MNSIRLSSCYRLYAFSDYQSMKSALPYMWRVVVAKRFEEVEEAEAQHYVWRISGKGYKSYLEPISNQNTQRVAISSLITALQELYKRNGYSAKYVVIERE